MNSLPVEPDTKPAMAAGATGPDESEDRFRLIFDHAPIAMAIIGLDGRYEQVNRSMCEFTGYTEAQLLDATGSDLSQPGDVAADTAAMADLLAGDRTSYTVDKRYLRPDGQVAWGAKSAILERSADGSPLHLIAQIVDITARKLAEQALNEEHRRLLEAESLGKVGSWEMDVATGAINWSRGLLELYGIDPDQFDGDYAAALECIHPDDREKVYAAVDRNQEGRAGYVRYRVTRIDDGALRWIDGRGQALYRDGEVVRIGGAVADVTEQVQAQAEAAAAQLFQQAAFAASPDNIAVWDLDARRVLWANRSIAEKLGYTAREFEELLPELVAGLMIGDDAAKFADSVAAVRSVGDGEVIELDFRMRHRDGTERCFSRRIAPLQRDETGRVTQIVGLTRDTTAAMAVQAALHESEVLYRQLAQSVDVAFLVRSVDPPKFLYISPGYRKIFGDDPLTDGESPLTSLRHVHPDDLEEFMVDYWEPSQAGRAASHDYRIVRADGEVRWVRAKTTPVADPDIAVRRAASTVEDITVIRRAEAARLAAATEMEKANAAKGQFFSRTSHELRTPLNAVLGFGQLLEMDPLTADQHDSVQQILRGGRHLVALIDDLLDISKIEGGRLETSMESVWLADLVSEVVRATIAPARRAGVAVLVDPSSSADRPVRADRRRLRQVLINLVSNGIKFNYPGGTVGISCRVVGDSSVDIAIRDSGCGIPVENLPRLFTPFDRLGAESTEVEGTGMGLALSYRLMTVMGGDLTAISQPGIGSIFTASVPLDVPSNENFAPPSETSTPVGPAGISDAPAKTLVYIEDNKPNVALIKLLITRRRDWRLLAAASGTLGLNLVTACEPDLVLLDLHLTDMDGINVLRTMRAKPATRDLKVVVVSADSNPHQVERLLSAGADGYLTKPLDLAQVMELLDAPVAPTGRSAG